MAHRKLPIHCKHMCVRRMHLIDSTAEPCPPYAHRMTNQERLIMGLPLEGIKIIDFTCVQAGPACTPFEFDGY